MSILDPLFRLMADKKASDLFMSSGLPAQIKIGGETSSVDDKILKPEDIENIAKQIMSPEQLATFTETKEMNLSIGVRDLGNFRINFFRQRATIAIVIRFILGNIPALNDLGLPSVLSELILEKRGLILVVGATGSGKSTTIASMLDHRNANQSGHILTIEDPIEFLFKHKKSIVNQRELGLDTHNWANALKSAMRQAPDCILIGEIRDRETMQAAISYAQTGHLCLATLHANNSYHALNRVINFFALENRSALYLDLSVCLKAIVSQRLVRKADHSRMPAVEVMLNTKHIQELIAQGEIPSIKDAMEKSLAPGSQTFEQDLLRLYTSGKISLDEALTNSESPTNLSWLINNLQKSAPANPEKTAAKNAAPENKNTASFSGFTINNNL